MIKIILLKIWKAFPLWMQVLLSRLIRPLFHVFAAAVILDQEDRVLLVKTTYNRFHPWGLPGGGLKYRELPEIAVIREVKEETSLNVDVTRFLFVKTLIPDRVGLFYLCRIVDGEFTPSDEVSEYGYFFPDALPDVRPVDVGIIREIYSILSYAKQS